MRKLVCNPMNLEYRYQIKDSMLGNGVFREAADPTMLLFHEMYFLFASMSGGFWYSNDLYDWKFKETPELPIYDYAPDVREVNGEVVFCASRRGENCTLYRSSDPLTVPFSAVSAPFAFWDPDVFQDDDGRVYFYWGCSNKEPIYGIELDAGTLMPVGGKKSLIAEKEAEHGWERKGENNRLAPAVTERDKAIRKAVGSKPFIEGAFMTKHDGKYYLQYAAPGTECNVYSDGVYVGEGPLGPFQYQTHNPFSSVPGGYLQGAGHGSTFCDKAGNWWHVSTMRISVNENFERRIGLFPCDFDADGFLYCNQNFACYPMVLPEGRRTDMDRTSPCMMLLSYGKTATASSSRQGCEPGKGVNENARSWWAAEPDDRAPWYQVDLGKVCRVEAVQVNFADHKLPMPAYNKDEMHKEQAWSSRMIWVQPQRTAYLLEGSENGSRWQILKDTRSANTDYSHDFITLPDPLRLRYIRVSEISVPMEGVAAISGLRVFGSGGGALPAPVKEVRANRTEDGRNILLRWDSAEGADGYNVRYGIAPEKQYSSWQLFGKTELDLSLINKGQSYCITVDSFNENGVSIGKTISVR